jgi:hypothetical protein
VHTTELSCAHVLVGEFGVVDALAVHPVIMAHRSNQNGRCDRSGMGIDRSSAAFGSREAADEPPLVFVPARTFDARAVTALLPWPPGSLSTAGAVKVLR